MYIGASPEEADRQCFSSDIVLHNIVPMEINELHARTEINTAYLCCAEHEMKWWEFAMKMGKFCTKCLVYNWKSVDKFMARTKSMHQDKIPKTTTNTKNKNLLREHEAQTNIVLGFNQYVLRSIDWWVLVDGFRNGFASDRHVITQKLTTWLHGRIAIHYTNIFDTVFFLWHVWIIFIYITVRWF